MLSWFRLKFVAVWLLIGVLVPGLLHYALHKRFDHEHGVVLSGHGGASYQQSYEDALKTRASLKEDVTAYIWNRTKAERLIIVKGRTRCLLLINGQIQFQKKGRPVQTGIIRFPEGFSEMHFHVEHNLKDLHEEVELSWSKDLVASEPIARKDCYVRPIGAHQLLFERATDSFGIVARLNVILICLWLLYKIIAQVASFSPSRATWTWLFIAGMVMIFAVRFAAIQYQVREGLHPDEEFYSSMIRNMRDTGDVAPQQFWYTTGYLFLAMGTQHIADWIAGYVLPINEMQRFLSALFSCLTCILIFYITRKLFRNRTAIIATFIFGFSFMPVELAGYGIVEPTMVFFFCLAFGFLVHLLEAPKISSFLVAGILSGIAIAVKQTAAIIAIPALVTLLSLIRQEKLRYFGALEAGTLVGGVIAGFIILSPGTIFDFSRFYQYQILQMQSLHGQTVTRFFFADHPFKFGELAWQGLHVGLGYFIVIAAALGLFLIWRKSFQAALLIVPTTLIYFITLCKVAILPEHYVLLLCPFVAILAAVTIDSIPALETRPVLIGFVTALLMLPNFVNVFTWVRLVQGTDTRRVAETWVNQYVPAGKRIDYEQFGPRFLIDIFDDQKIRLFRRPSWDDYRSQRYAQYIVEDSITADLFFSSPDSFEKDIHWYRSLEQNADVVKEFHGESFGLLNPDIKIYKLRESD